MDIKPLSGDLYVVEYEGVRVAHSRLAPWSQNDEWIGLTSDDDVYPEDLHCRRLDSGPRRADPPGSTILPEGYRHGNASES